MLIGGLDPGLDGAFAVLDAASERVVAAIQMPALRLAKGRGTKRELQPRLFIEQVSDGLYGQSVARVFVERVSSSPQMGVASAFAFGRTFEGPLWAFAALGWPIDLVTAAEWKRGLRVPKQKEDAVARACQLMPLDTRHWRPIRGEVTKAQAIGRAEAALIALWGIRQQKEGR